MTYKEQLSPWCLIRLLPKMQRLTVARFRRRSDAEAQLHLLKRMVPQGQYVILFEPNTCPLKPTDLTSESPLPLSIEHIR